MNFEIFNEFYKNADFDEVKVIGKDVEKEGRPYYILGMTLKEKKASLHILEMFDESLREKYDICVSRAVANLSTLSELCIPFVKVGGLFVSYKSEKISEEALYKI